MYTLSLLYIIKLMMMDFIILPIFCQIYDQLLKIHFPKKLIKFYEYYIPACLALCIEWIKEF